MPLPELTAAGKENGVVDPPAITDDASSSKKRRAGEPAASSTNSAADTTYASPDPDTNVNTSNHADTTGTTHDGAINEDDDDEVAYWKRQFYDLRNKRETEAEAQYKVLKDRTQQREKSLKAYIRDIEEQLAEAKGTIKASAAKVAEAEAAAADAAASAASAVAKAEAEASVKAKSDADSNDLEDQLSEASTTMRVQRQIISHYKMLTGIKVTNVTSQSLDVAVRNVQRDTAASFRLTSVRSQVADETCTSTEISLRLDPLDGMEHLPEYMRTAIEFGVDQCPTLMREVLDNMFPDEE